MLAGQLPVSPGPEVEELREDLQISGVQGALEEADGIAARHEVAEQLEQMVRRSRQESLQGNEEGFCANLYRGLCPVEAVLGRRACGQQLGREVVG